MSLASLGAGKAATVPVPLGPYTDEVEAEASLVHYWRLGETSGTAAVDIGPGAKDLTYTNTPSLNQTSLLTSDADPAVSFDSASSEHASRASDAGLVTLFQGSFSIEAWIKPTSLAATRCWFGVFDGTYGGGTAIDCRVNTDGALRLGFYADDLTSAASVISAGSVYHVVCTRDNGGDTAKIYANGVQVATGANGPFVGTAAPVSVGRLPDPSEYFLGVIDEVAVYNTALSAARVADHYAAGIA